MNVKTENEKKSYLAFRLGGEIFAVGVEKVLEILELQPITKVPKTPAFIRGVINMRGEVIPVIDTRIKFNMAVAEDTVRTVIIVLDLIVNDKKVLLGAVADSVKEVLEITQKDIKPVPEIGSNYNSDFITGMIKSDDKFIMLLDIDLIFSMNDLVNINENSLQEVSENNLTTV